MTEQNCGEIALKLSLPLVALGASAATYYPAIASSCAELIVPDHAEVAGAVAAAGDVRQRGGLVTQPSTGLFRVHLAAGPHDVKSREEALVLARAAADLQRSKQGSWRCRRNVGCLTETIDEVPVGPENCLFLQATITPKRMRDNGSVSYIAKGKTTKP